MEEKIRNCQHVDSILRLNEDGSGRCTSGPVCHKVNLAASKQRHQTPIDRRDACPHPPPYTVKHFVLAYEDIYMTHDFMPEETEVAKPEEGSHKKYQCTICNKYVRGELSS